MAQNLTPTTIDAFYGPDAHHRYDHYKHPIRDPGGNPLYIHRHGGGWQVYDKRNIAFEGEESNTTAIALLAQQDVHFDVISIETRQAQWGSPISTATFGYNEPSTVPTYYPEAWMDYKRAILHFKLNAASIGINPDKIICGGGSAGACIAAWSQLTPPLVAGQTNEGADIQGGYLQRSSVLRQTPASLTDRVDSTTLGVWAHQLIPDFRKTNAGTETVTAANWYNAYGVANATAAAALPKSAREAISAMAYVENGTPYRVPIFATYLQTQLSFTGAAYDASAGTITKTGAFASTYLNYQAGDVLVGGTPNGGNSVLITGRTSDDVITVAANAFGTADATISGTIVLGKPYGGTNRDVHDQQQGLNMQAACDQYGYPGYSTRVYTTFTAGEVVAWMKGLVR